MPCRPARLLVSCLVAACALGACGPEVRDPTRPDLVLLTLDTTRRDRLTFYGYARETTPRLQALADSGMVFEDAISVHTNTAPAHASMLTGLYPRSHAVERNTDALADEVETLPEILREHGYDTAAFISGRTLRRRTGLSRGFDVYDDMVETAWRRNGRGTVDAAVAWLESRTGERPFFLWVHLFDVHYPYQPPQELLRVFLGERAPAKLPHARGLKTQRRLSPEQVEAVEAGYDAAILYADHHLGRLLNAIADRQIAETFIALTADHGETLHERDWAFDHGARVTDEQIRVPLVLCCRSPGSRIAGQVSVVDVMPTFLDVAGLPAPAGISGRSLLAAEPAGAPRPVFSHARPERERVPELPAELAERLVEKGLIDAVRVPPHKLVAWPTSDGGRALQLFDLESDPGETRDVAAEQPRRVQALGALLEQWRASTRVAQAAAAPALSPEDEEALRALGYIE